MIKIQNDTQYELALKRVHELWGCEIATPEAIEFETLVDALDDYENERWPFPEPTPAEAAAFRDEQENSKRDS